MRDNSISVDFKVIGDDNRGIYYHDSQRVVVFLNKHESLSDLMKTIDHELLHHCIWICEEEMDDDQEERTIYQLQWAEITLGDKPSKEELRRWSKNDS